MRIPLRAVPLALLPCVLLGPLGCDGDVPMKTGRPGAATQNVSGKLTLCGSTTLMPLMKDIAARLRERHPGLEVEVNGGGSGKGISDARDGKVDIGMSSRELNDKEELDLQSFPVARDGVCALVHRDNPVKGLTHEQFHDLVTGKSTNWKELGGKDAPIFLIARAKGRSEVEIITHYLKIKPEDIKSQATAGGNQEGIKMVAENPNAITYLSVGESDTEAKKGRSIKLLAADGVAATPVNVGTGAFPIARPLILVTRGLPKGSTKTLIDFSISPQVKDMVKAHGFIPYLD